MARIILQCLLLCLFAARLNAQQDSLWGFYEPKLNLPDKPTVALLYGPMRQSLRDLNQGLASGGVAEIKLGFSRLNVGRMLADVIEYQFTYLSCSRLSHTLAGGSGSGGVDTDVWRFGVGWDKGYGYSIGGSALTLFHSFGAHWSSLKVKSPVTDTTDSAVLSLYDGTVRFGTKTEGGVLFHIVPSVIVGVSLDRSLILSRHLFWKWAGSMLIEGMGHGLIDRFVDKVMKSSPGAGPVVNFILKNGLSYGLYELRRGRMNWPFDTEPPILHDTFKFGLTVMF